MEYLIKTPSFNYLISYKNDSTGFRGSKVLTINKKASEEVENYLKNRKNSSIIKTLKDKGFKLKEVSIKGNYNQLYPMHLQVEITDNCNLNCGYCYRDSFFNSKKSKEINLLKLEKFLSFLKKKNLLEIGITGGEPTINSNFLKIMKYSLKNFEVVELITNGTNPERILRLFKEISTSEKEKLNISVSFHDWTKNIENLKIGHHYLNNFINKIGKIHPLRFILTDVNYSDKKSQIVQRLLKNKGIKKVDFSFVSPIGRAKNKITELDYIKKYPLMNKNKKPNLNLLNCSLIFKHTSISPEGDLRPCALFPASFKIGEINKKFVTKKFLFLGNLPCPSKKICGTCDYLNYCNGCILKGLYNSNESCLYRKELKKDYPFL